MSYLCYLIEGNWHHWVHKSQDEDKQKQNKTLHNICCTPLCAKKTVLFMLFVGGLMSYLCYLWEVSCLIYVICVKKT
jgi:hypothetical protein